jgi:hypothetical protein
MTYGTSVLRPSGIRIPLSNATKSSAPLASFDSHFAEVAVYPDKPVLKVLVVAC